MSYAEKTTVSSESSRGEIERILMRYGADQFAYGWTEDGAVIQFRADGRYVKFVLPMPAKTERRFTHVNRGRTHESWQPRTADAAHKAWEQETRRMWRALALAVKAKLEVVASGISSFENEFMGNIVLPSGETVGEWMAPQIDEAYGNGGMPERLQLALPAAGGTS